MNFTAKLFYTLMGLALAGVACTKKADRVEPAVGQTKLKVGLVLDKGGKDDKSFNAAAFKGAIEAKKKFNIELKTIESPDDTAYEPAMRQLALRGYPLIITVGFSQADALKKVSKQFPKTHFAIVDAFVEAPNVDNLIFSEHEGSFLVGYIAGLKTKTNILGFVGGMAVDLIKRFELGYREGAKLSNPKVQVLSNYAGVKSEAWMNPAKGKELALSQIAQGADIVFAVAGATGQGVFDAIEETHTFAIGVDSNENWVKPGLILTSMLKRVDIAVFNTINSETEGHFGGGNKYFGLANGGVDYAVDKYNDALITPAIRLKTEKIRSDIVSGKIKVSDYYITRKLCPSSPFKCDKSPRPTPVSRPMTQ